MRACEQNVTVLLRNSALHLHAPELPGDVAVFARVDGGFDDYAFSGHADGRGAGGGGKEITGVAGKERGGG